MQKIIGLVLFSLLLVGCASTQTITHTEQFCPVPPPIVLSDHPGLSLSVPVVQIVTVDGEEPYFRLSQMDFALWLENNKKLESYIMECRLRTDYVIEYYEQSLSQLR